MSMHFFLTTSDEKKKLHRSAAFSPKPAATANAEPAASGLLRSSDKSFQQTIWLFCSGKVPNSKQFQNVNVKLTGSLVHDFFLANAGFLGISWHFLVSLSPALKINGPVLAWI